jgi:hypothetical protein
VVPSVSCGSGALCVITDVRHGPGGVRLQALIIHNRRGRHTALGMLTSIDYEKLHTPRLREPSNLTPSEPGHINATTVAVDHR